MRRSHNGQLVFAHLVLGQGDSLIRKAGGHGFEHNPQFELRINKDQDNVDREGDGGKGMSVSEQLAEASYSRATAIVEDDFKAQVAAAKSLIEMLSTTPLAELAAKIASRNKLVKLALAVNLP
jgi:hypothetical protein